MGMPTTHTMASGLGGMRTSGDLVARMQMTKAMKIDEAKQYVAKKLGIEPIALGDVHVMRELREELDIGVITSVPKASKGMGAKIRIADFLGIEINSVNNFLDKMPRKKE